MEAIRLGDSDLVVTRVGFGGCPLGGHGWGDDIDREESIEAVKTALDLGVNFFDTADVYGLGHSEETLAHALGKKRHDVLIASKFGVRWDTTGRTWKDISPGYLRQALEASLRRLNVEAISLYYVHWPDGVNAVADTIGELERCREEGKIRAIGVSNFSAEQIREACAVADIAAAQVQYSLVDRGPAEAIREAAAANNVSLVTWGSLAQGLLTGKYDARARFGKNDRRHRYENFLGEKLASNLQVLARVKEVAKRNGMTPAQVAIRWLLDTPSVGCVLFGAKRPQQVEDNAGAAICPSLPVADYRLLESWPLLGGPLARAG